MPTPESFLHGAYAYSYTGKFYKPATPLLGTEHSFAGYIDFDGNGNLSGAGMVNLFNITPAGPGVLTAHPVNFNGTYNVMLAPVPTGTLQQIDAVNPAIKIDYYFVMADDWKELKFMILKESTGKLTMVAGTMRKVAIRHDEHNCGD